MHKSRDERITKCRSTTTLTPLPVRPTLDRYNYSPLSPLSSKLQFTVNTSIYRVRPKKRTATKSAVSEKSEKWFDYVSLRNFSDYSQSSSAFTRL